MWTYSIFRKKKESQVKIKRMMFTKLKPWLRTGIPLGTISAMGMRNISSDSSAATAVLPDITIYQYKICPYCNRPKTFLDYLNVPYKAVEVNPLTKSQLSFSKEYKKVPVMTMGGDNAVVSDSMKIIDALKDVLSANPEKKIMITSLFTEDT